MKAKKPSSIGRPRAFDTGQALEHALRVFWKKGYEGASLSDLTGAMGINRPSLYAAFGNKESLFRKVLDCYANGPADYVHKALDQPNARAVAEALLYGAADRLTNSAHPPGCLLIGSALTCGNEADPIRKEVATRRAQGQSVIQERFKRAITEGDLPSDTDPADLALFVSTVLYGMAVQAAGGATRVDLRRVAKTALRSWPV